MGDDAPVDVRESAPRTTPPSNSTAMMEVPVETPPGMVYSRVKSSDIRYRHIPAAF